MSKDLFVTGTDTGVGKTVLSALLVAALDRQYWKPIQTGACEGTDRNLVIEWAGVSPDRTIPEVYIFDPPVSPHLAAEMAGVSIDLERIRRPSSSEPVIIEGAGGVFVPINPQAYMLDLIRHCEAAVVIAVRTTLGTINHTLLTIAALRQAGADLRGVIMIGHENVENRRAIEKYGNVSIIGSIPWLDRIDRPTLCSVFERYFDARAFA